MTEDQNQALAKRLKAAREQAGLSQETVSRILGLKRPAISEIEAGRRKVSAHELSVMSELYHVSMDWLMSEGTGQPEKLEIAARSLAKMKPEDLDRIMALLKSLREPDKK